MKQKRFILPENEIPTQWFNIQAVMKNKPLPMLNPATKEAIKAEDLYPVFCEECARQEVNRKDAWIDIPEEELEDLLGKLRELTDSYKADDLLETLKAYLENNLNYSTTAAKLFVHINTVRKRIEKVEEALGMNFDDHIIRLKLVILLQYLSR